MTSATAHEGALSAVLEQTTVDPATLARTVSGLTVGRSHTLSGWVASSDDDTVESEVTVAVSGIGASMPIVLDPAVSSVVAWVPVSYQFTATTESHEIVLSGTAVTGDASILVDDVSVVQDAWVEAGAELSPGTVPGESVRDEVIRSQSGRIMSNTLADG